MTIFIQAYRSFSMRYIACTDILTSIIERGHKIVFFVADDEVEYFRKSLNHENIIIESVHYKELFNELRQSKLRTIVNLIRIMTSGSSKEIKNTTIKHFLKMQYKEEFSKGFGPLIFLIMSVICWVTSNSKWARTLLTLLISRLFSGDIYNPYFVKYRPSTLLISSLGYGIDPHIMNAAKRYDCKIISIPHSWDNPSVNGYRGSKPDFAFAWNRNMKEEMQIFHDLDPNNIIIGGVAHWDKYLNGEFKPGDIKTFCKTHGLDSKKKILLYALSGPTNFEKRFTVVDGIMNLIANDLKEYDLQLLVRFHPLHMHTVDGKFVLTEKFAEEYSKLTQKYGELINFWLPDQPHLDSNNQLSMSDMYSMAEAICHSAILLQEYSTLILESTVFNKPTINISMYKWRQLANSDQLEKTRHLSHILKYQSCATVRTFKELEANIINYLKNPDIHQENRKQLFENEVNINPGVAGKFIGDTISDIMSNRV